MAEPIQQTPAAEVLVYISPLCPYCHAAQALLDRKGVSYRQINVDADPQLRREMTERSGRRTVPQIFIDGRAVGGYDDLAVLERAGRLDPLLAGSAVTSN